MKIVIYLAVMVVGAFAGMHYESVQIQKSCDDPDAPTVLNGQTYVCLDGHQMEILRGMIRRGKEA